MSSIGEIAKFRTSVQVDTIDEFTNASGVTIDGVLLKDAQVTASGANGIITNTITERTAASGVTIDGVLLKDGGVYGSTSGVAPAAGVIGESVSISRVRSSGTSLTTNTPVNVGTTTKITLSKGSYVFHAIVGFLPAAATVVTQLDLAISKTSATLPASSVLGVPTNGELWIEQGFVDAASAIDMNLTASFPVLVTSDNTDFYLVSNAIFTNGALSTYGSFFATRIA